MSDQPTEQANAQAPAKSRLGWLPWGLLGGGLYLLDQVSKLWIVNHFPLNVVNEKKHAYFYNPGFGGFYHVGADDTEFFSGAIPPPEMVAQHPLHPNTVEAMDKLRELEPISFFDGMLNITRVHNTGVAFGFGNGTAWSGYVFLAVPVLALIAITVMYCKNFFNTLPLKISYVLLLAGIAGNLTDRLIQGFLLPYECEHGFFTKLMNGYVVDFIDVTIPFFNYRWPAFNVADSCIFVAAFVFFFAGIFASKNEPKPQKV